MTVFGESNLDGMLAIRDRYLAPSLLSPFADDMARRLSRLNNGPVLETVADVGVLTQAMSVSLSAGLSIIATDPCKEAIEIASVKPGMSRVNWQRADPRALPFEDDIFGIVTSLFGIATVPDRIGAFKEARRVMKHTGRYVFSIPGQMRYNPVVECLQSAMEALFPSDPPRFLADRLHGYASNEVVDDELTAAGFTDAVYSTVDLPFAVASAQEVAIGYCLGTPLRTEIAGRPGGDPGAVARSVTQALQERFGTGRIEATMRALVVSAAG